MSILINGMEMPKAGYIDVRIFPDGIASKAIGEKPYYKEFHVVEVKAPHGRLIDADALRARMYHEAFETDSDMQRWESGCWIRYKMFERTEEAAPTIIPAEDGEP